MSNMEAVTFVHDFFASPPSAALRCAPDRTLVGATSMLIRAVQSSDRAYASHMLQARAHEIALPLGPLKSSRARAIHRRPQQQLP